MAELGKIDKPEAASFKSRRKLYVVPTLPFEELALEFKIENAKITGIEKSGKKYPGDTERNGKVRF